MTKCLLCERTFYDQISLADVLLWRPNQQMPICNQCKQAFDPLTGHPCIHCGRILATKDADLCADCQKWQKQKGWVHHNQALVKYNPQFRKWILQLKQTGDLRLCHYFDRSLQKNGQTIF